MIYRILGSLFQYKGGEEALSIIKLFESVDCDFKKFCKLPEVHGKRKATRLLQMKGVQEYLFKKGKLH